MNEALLRQRTFEQIPFVSLEQLSHLACVLPYQVKLVSPNSVRMSILTGISIHVVIEVLKVHRASSSDARSTFL